MLDWENSQYAFQICSAILATISNSLLIYLITHFSPKDIGDYKHLMLFISLFEVVYAILDLIVQPIFYSFGATFTLIVNTSNSRIDKGFWEIMAVVYCGFFGSSMAIFSLHYVYRYWVITGNSRNLSYFKGRRIFWWLIIPFSIGLIWALVGYFPCYPRKGSSEYLRQGVQEKLGQDIDKIVYFAPYFYEKNDAGQDVIYWPSFVGICLDSMSINLSMFVVVFYGVKCWNKMRSILTTTSSHLENIQNQLFYALVAQTIIPIFLMHIPALTMFMFSFFELDAGHLSGLVSLSIALFPALDPIPTILIISSYRDAIKKFVKKKCLKFRKTKIGKLLVKRKTKVESSHSALG